MKKRFTFLTAAMLLLSLMVPSLAVWGGQIRTEEVAYTLTPASGSNNSYTGNCDITISDITWNLEGNSQQIPWRLGGKSISNVNRNLYSKTAISDNITKIEVTHGTASSITVNSWTVIVSKNSDFSSPVSTLTPTFAANTTTTINRPDGVDWSNCYFKFVYNVSVSGSNNKYLEFSKAKFYKEASGGGTYIVTYNANDGSQNPDTYQVTDATSPHTVLAIDDENIGFTYESHVFSNWHTTADGTSGTSYTAGNEMPLSADVTLYAQWKALRTITFDAGSGICATSSLSYADGTVINEFPEAEPSEECAARGWTFAGWATTSADDETTDPTVSSYTVISDATLYAVYRLGIAPFDNTEGGEYKIYANVSGTNYYAKGNVSNKALQSTNDPDQATLYTFEKISDGIYKIKNGNTYVGSNNSADLNTNETEWTITESNTNYGKWKVVQASGRALLYRTSTYNYFKNYSTAGVNGTEYFYVEIGGGSSTYATSPSCNPQVATPVLSHGSNTYIGTQSVTISCDTEGASIFYTLGSGEPTTPYTGDISISENSTLKAVAKLTNYDDSEIVTATYTIIQPLTKMEDVYKKAVEVGSTSTEVYITFNNWVVTGTNSTYSPSQVYLTDGTNYGCVIFKNTSTDIGLVAGNTLNGTVRCNVQMYSSGITYSYAQLTNLTSGTDNLNIGTGGNVTPSVTTINQILSANTGTVITLNNVTYNGTYLTDENGDVINLSTTIFNPSLTAMKTYDITGVFTYKYANNNTAKYINPRSANDIVLKAGLDIDASMTPFSYIVNEGPSAEQNIDVICTDLGDNILTATASSDYEVSLAYDGTYTQSVEMTPENGEVLANVYVRLKADRSVGEHNGTVTFTATNLTTATVNVTGLVTENQTFEVILDDVANGTISADPMLQEAGKTVTLIATPDDCYQFTTWVTEPTVTWVSDNQFTMPEDDVLVSATFTQKKFTVNYSVNGTIEDALVYDNIDCGEETYMWDADELDDKGITLPSGCTFVGWSTSAGSIEIVDNFIPEEDATLYAVLAKTVLVSSTIYQKVKTAPSDWSGEYLIVSSGTVSNVDYSVAFKGSLSSLDANSNKIDVTIIENGDNYEIKSTEEMDANTFTIASMNGGYSIQSAHGEYIGRTAGSNGMEMGNVPVANVISMTNGVLSITGTNNGTSAKLQYNADKNTWRFRYYTSIQKDIQLFKKTTTTVPVPITHTLVEEVVSETPLSLDSISSSYMITVKDGGVLTITGNTAGTGTAANLIIEDGGELVINNPSANVQATFQKSITTAAAKDDQAIWYTIASPIAEMDITDVTNLVDGEGLYYNLYRYNETVQSSQWEAYNTTNHADFTTLESGRGYLYRNNGKPLAFAGEVTTGAVEVTVTNTIASGKLRGFNLIGNPYGHTIYKGKDAAIYNANLADGFYYLKENGTWLPGDYKVAITPNMGILVKLANNEDPTKDRTEKFDIIDTPNKPTQERYGNDNLKFMVSNSEFEDVAYVMFHEGNGLNKINHRNAKAPMLFVPQGGDNYAIAMMNDNTKVFGLGFKAATMGQYTLRYKADGNFNYLHVVDRLTGADVDMLLDGEYTFVAAPGDSESRFIVKLEYMPNYSEGDSEMFAYQCGSEILVSGSGELQIFDITGRKVITSTINGAEAVRIPAQGVYILKLNDKIQKIVVR